MLQQDPAKEKENSTRFICIYILTEQKSQRTNNKNKILLRTNQQKFHF